MCHTNMAKKKKTKSEPEEKIITPNSKLRAGMVFEKKNHIYTRQMIITDRAIPCSDGNIYRECVAWNDDRCRRFDTTEAELLDSEHLFNISQSDLSEYVYTNNKNKWEEIKRPKGVK